MIDGPRDAAIKSAMIFVAFVLVYCCAVWNFSASQPFPWPNYDEPAHYSYVQHLLHQHRWWPDFAHFYIYDRIGDASVITSERNYLNHPPFFYWAMKLFAVTDPAIYRLFALSFYCAAIALYARIGYHAKLPKSASLLYVLVPFTFYVSFISGFFNNDSWAMFGGALCCYGTFRWLENNASKTSLAYILIGLLFAAVKLTALLLVGSYVMLVMLLAFRHQRRIHRLSAISCLAVLALCSLPYLYFIITTGSPAPHTPGQIELMTEKTEWMTAPRMPLGTWFITMLADFADQFKGKFEVTFLPMITLLIAWVVGLRKFCRADHSPIAVIARAAAIATLLTLTIHLVFSYQRYLKYGWLYDALIRYYFPLLPAYGLTIVQLYPQARTRIARRK